MFGVPGGDLTGSIAQLQALVDGRHFPFLPGRITAFSAPDGAPITWALNLASLPSLLPLWLLAHAFGAPAAFAIFTLAGFAVSGLAMFLLVRKLTSDPGIALLLGWTFAFFPFAVSQGHNPQFLHGWPLVLLSWRVLALAEAPSARTGLLAGAAAVLTAWWTPYFILLGGACYLALTVGVLAFAPGDRRPPLRRRIAAHAWGFGVFLVFLALFVGLASFGPSATGARTSDIGELHDYASKPLEYLAPSPENPLAGRWTEAYLAGRVPVYIGVSILALAAIAALLAVSRRRRSPLARVVGAFALVALVAFAFMQPPTVSILGREIWLPSFATYHLSPTWRIYARFVLVLMLAAAVAAAVGLRWLLERRSTRVRVLALGFAMVLVPLDLWAKPEQASWPIEVPTIYSALRAQPPGGLVEYPIRSVDFSFYRDIFGQHYHGRQVLGGFARGSVEELRAYRVGRLGDPETAGMLRTVGMRYVLLPRGSGAALGVAGTYVEPGEPGTGFRLLAEDPLWRLYRLSAAPLPLVTPLTGFLHGVDVERSSRPHWWIGQPRAEIELFVGCRSCRGTLTLTLTSVGVPRRVTLGAGGRPLVEADVGTQPTEVSVPVDVRRRLIVTIASDPGSLPLPGPGDPAQAQARDELLDLGAHRASLLLQSPRFVRIAARS